MKKKLFPVLFAFSLSLLLAACQFSVGSSQLVSSAAMPTAPAAASPTNTPRPTPTQHPTTAPTPTTAPFAFAEEAAKSYAAALEKGDFAAAAEQLSSYGLMVASLTRGDVTAQWKAASEAAQVGAFKILDSRQATANTVLVHVSYTSGKDTATRDELWPFREENGVWRYNWNNLVDFHTLTVDPQTTNGITLIPLRLLRFSSYTRLELMGQNHTNEAVIMGQPNEILASFHFGDTVVEAEKTHLALEPLRTNNNLALDAKGYYETYPTSIDIRKWRDFNEKPWFSFVLP